MRWRGLWGWRNKALWAGSGLCVQQDSGAWAKFACSDGDKRTYTASSKYAVAMKLAKCAGQHKQAPTRAMVLSISGGLPNESMVVSVGSGATVPRAHAIARCARGGDAATVSTPVQAIVGSSHLNLTARHLNDFCQRAAVLAPL